MIHKLIYCGIATPESLVGCGEDMIEKIRIGQKVDFLPHTYRQFLQTMGRKAGNLYQGSDYTCSVLPKLKEAILYDLEFFQRPFRVPSDAFIFMAHQGYVFWYFHTSDKNDDPAVYRYHEDDQFPTKVNDHLSDFFDDSIRELSPNRFAEYRNQHT